MKRYEYACVTDLYADKFEEQLQQYGADGWKLVTVMVVQDYYDNGERDGNPYREAYLSRVLP